MIHNIELGGTLSWMPRKKLPQSEKKAPLAARVDPDLLEQFTGIARADERTISFMVERAIREFVERHLGKCQSKAKHR